MKFLTFLNEKEDIDKLYKGYELSTYYDNNPPMGGKHYRAYFKVPGTTWADNFFAIGPTKEQALENIRRYIDASIKEGKIKDRSQPIERRKVVIYGKIINRQSSQVLVDLHNFGCDIPGRVLVKIPAHKESQLFGMSEDGLRDFVKFGVLPKAEKFHSGDGLLCIWNEAGEPYEKEE